MSEKKTNHSVSFEALSSLDAPVSFWKGIPFGLQHVMAMFVANLAPIFIVASAAKMTPGPIGHHHPVRPAGCGPGHLPATVRRVAHRLATSDGHRHLLHLRGGRRGDLRGQGLWRGGRRGNGRRSAGTCAGFDGQVLASVRAAHRLRHRGHVDRLLAAQRGCHELRRRQRSQGLRFLAEPDARAYIFGCLPGVPAVDEGHGQAAVRAVRSGGRLCGGYLHGQGRFLRFPEPRHRVRAAVHAVQA